MSVTVRFDPTANSQQAAIIANASEFNDGVMTLEMVAQLNQAVATTDSIIYASPTGNDNNNDGLTPETAVQTPAKAHSLVPAAWTGLNQIVFADGTYTFSDLNTIIDSGLQKGPTADPYTWVGGFTNEIGDRTETVGDPNGAIFTPSGAPVLANIYEGATISCVSSPVVGFNNVGQRRMITENTTTQFQVNFPFFAPIVVGEVYVIERPSVTITFSDPGDSLSFSGSFMAMKGIKIICPLGGNGLCFLDGKVVAFNGCELDCSNQLEIRANAKLITVGFDDQGRQPTQGNDLFSIFQLGSGVFFHSGTIRCLQSTITGFCVFRQIYVNMLGGLGLSLVNVDSKDSSFQAQTGADMFHIDFTGGLLPGRLLGQQGSHSDQGIVNYISTTSEGLFGIDISGSDGCGVLSTERAYAFLGDVTTGAATGIRTAGAVNATYGAIAIGMSQVGIVVASQVPIDVRDSVLGSITISSPTSVTGTLNDTLVGSTPETYVALDPLGFGETNANGPTLNRIGPFNL